MDGGSEEGRDQRIERGEEVEQGKEDGILQGRSCEEDTGQYTVYSTQNNPPLVIASLELQMNNCELVYLQYLTSNDSKVA